MPVKMPSARRLLYKSGALTQNFGSQAAISLPKDLSIVNRRGYASTDEKGVPYVFLCQVDMYRVHSLTTANTLDNQAHAADFATALSVQVAPNNWVTKNAAIKWHAAREAMWKKAGVKKSDRGAYSKAIRYNWNTSDQTWAEPLDGFSTAYIGGTWDPSIFADGLDQDYQLKLVGTAVDEGAATTSITALNIAHSYLASRATVPVDSNLESDDTPAAFSHLNTLMRMGMEGAGSLSDDIVTDAKDGQDNPPYDLFVPGDTTNDITEEVEAGRAILGVGGNGITSMIIEVPFGIMMPRLCHIDSDNTDEDSPIEYAVTVLDIYPMQG